MSTENLTKQRQFIWQELEQLHGQADLGVVKQDLVKMFKNSLLSEFLNDPEERHHIFFSFKQLYNFMVKAEMHKDPTIKGANTL